MVTGFMLLQNKDSCMILEPVLQRFSVARDGVTALMIKHHGVNIHMETRHALDTYKQTPVLTKKRHCRHQTACPHSLHSITTMLYM